MGFKSVLKYWCHCLTARNTNGFGVHSPFLYQFTQLVLREKHYFYVFSVIENLRSFLKNDTRSVFIKDFGTGVDRESTVSKVLNKSVSDKRVGQLLFRIIHYYKLNNVLELGTSIGVTTSYLSSSSKSIKCVTFEGSDELATVAQENFVKLNLSNIEIVVGDINETLKHKLSEIEKLDFVFMDANHKSTAILNYFDQCLEKSHNDTIFVFDDINWSDDMLFAWNEIKNYPQVTSTINLFHFGIVFLNKDLYKKHYKMRF